MGRQINLDEIEKMIMHMDKEDLETVSYMVAVYLSELE